MKKIVYITVEVKARELIGKLLLALELLKRGYVVFIGDVSKVYAKAEESVNAGILIDKCFGPSSYPHWKKIHQNQGKVYSWDEESIVYMSKKYYMNQRVDRQSLSEIDGIIVWGEDQRENFLSEYPDIKTRLAILGNPRVDILNEKFIKLWEQKVFEYNNRFGDYILVNYSLTTNFDEIEKVKINFNKSNFITTADKDLFEGRLHWVTEYTKQFNEGIEYLARNTTKVIIIRPHPGDNGENLRKQFSGYANVHIISEGNSNPWILGADVMIHQGSTSSVEAYIQNKYSILYAPVFEPRYYGKLAVDVSLVVRNKEDLVEYANNAALSERKAFFTEDKDKALSHYIYRQDHKLAVERIADLIDKNRCSKEPYTGKFKMSAVNKIRLRREIQNRSLVQSKNELTDPKEIRMLLHQLEQSMNYKMKYNVKCIDQNLFMLTPKVK